jgi:hypothetical protein
MNALLMLNPKNGDLIHVKSSDNHESIFRYDDNLTPEDIKEGKSDYLIEYMKFAPNDDIARNPMTDEQVMFFNKWHHWYTLQKLFGTNHGLRLYYESIKTDGIYYAKIVNKEHSVFKEIFIDTL